MHLLHRHAASALLAICHLVVGVFVLSGVPNAAQAQQSAPPGSYLGSCESVAVDGANVLHATCLTPVLAKITTTLQLPCVGAIDNINGVLTCNKAPSSGAPAGSYVGSCTDARVDGDVLRATCESANHGPRQTFLVLPCDGAISNMDGNLRCDRIPSAPIDGYTLVSRFAPVLKFTSNADGFGYPMSPNGFWAKWTANGTNNGGIGADAFGVVENTDPNTVTSGAAPTYFSYRKFGNQVRITYWWFYGMQHPCWASSGSHPGDWERVMVILSEDQSRVAAVQYYQHNQMYLRISGPRDAPCTPGGVGRCNGSGGFETENGRPVVYVGRTAKGSYHDTYGGIDGAGSCAYYGDARGSGGPTLDTNRTLIDLDGAAEPWLAADRSTAFSWGPDGISTHPTQRPATATMDACEGNANFAVENAGCFKSEALAGDDQASMNALKECKPGYDNVGLTCNKGVLPWDWSIYGRLNPGNYYEYDYTIPTSDVGLVRRRSQDGDWNLP